tara:strand:+ start:321 stop:791 length:471 start_codon:yes stop_codon:yes gene_type:complete
MNYNFERNRINQYIKFYNNTNKKLKKLGGSTKEIINLNQDLQKEDEEPAKFFYPPTIYPQPIMSYQYITTDPNLKLDNDSKKYDIQKLDKNIDNSDKNINKADFSNMSVANSGKEFRNKFLNYQIESKKAIKQLIDENKELKDKIRELTDLVNQNL